MKLGGHETFYPRPGWLTKGLLHLCNGGAGTFSQPEIADDLGVGRNMAKSIGWWLAATGLAKRQTRSGPLEVTEFGAVIADHDPFMVHLGTWWLLHAAAMTSATETSLPWFFSPRRGERTERAILIEALHKDIGSGKAKPPALKSVQREVAVILQTYAVPVPRPLVDPEDNLGSPFHRLNLWRHLHAADRIERSEPTPTPPEAVALVLSAFGMRQSGMDLIEGKRIDAVVSGPVLGRSCAVFGRTRDELLHLADTAERALGADLISLSALAGERSVVLSSGRAATWAARYYARMADMGRDRVA